MKESKIYINDNEYTVRIAVTDEDKSTGLQGCEEL